ncbi:MAG: serine/threonine-protein phosphatase [Lachnospiraceae bacterium]|nr:serine/threonine-protein phosphatase [Lachnospiraceae bacterium]
MENTQKKNNHLAEITASIYIAMIVAGIVFVKIRGLENLKDVYLINIGVDIFGMFVGYVILVCSLIDMKRTGTDQKYLIYLLNITYFGLFTDLVAWVVNEVPSLWIVNLIDNTLYYMCMPVCCYCFWKYVTVTIKHSEKTEKTFDKLLKIGLIISLLLKVVNAFTGIYFVVDKDGEYSRSTFYPISMLYLFVTSIMTLLVIIKRRHKISSYQLAVLLIYVFGPTAAGIFTISVYGLSISYGVIMAVLVLMYCLINLEQSREKVVADRELSMAAQIQKSMLPHIFPPFPQRTEFELYASMDPAREVGGDFYDFYLVDEDHLFLVMADVSGKGVPAALFMMISKTILQSCAMLGKSVEETLVKTNEALCSNNQVEMFVTVWMGVLEISTGKLTAANAGHEYPIIKKANGEFELYKEKHGLPLGAMDGMPYTTYEVTLEPGSKLFLYTDGVPEATDSENRQFGMDRLLVSLNCNSDAEPDQIIRNVREDVDVFVKDTEQFDDITMLCLEYKGGEP